MQDIRYLSENQTLASSVNPLNNAIASLLSQNSGKGFPQTNLEVGQLCFRTDELALYQLANAEQKTWVKIADLTLTFVSKEYVDNLTIPVDRIENLVDPSTRKIKISLMDTGTTQGKLIVVGDNNKIPTSLIDTGTTKGKVLVVGSDGKLPNSLLNVGTKEGQVPLLGLEGKLSATTLPNSVVKFDADNSITFPNGNRLFIGG